MFSPDYLQQEFIYRKIGTLSRKGLARGIAPTLCNGHVGAIRLPPTFCQGLLKIYKNKKCYFLGLL